MRITKQKLVPVLVILWVLIWFILGGALIAKADVGEIEICNSRTDFNLSGISINSSVEAAQTFTAAEIFSMSGVKLPIQHFSAQPDAVFQVDIYPTVSQGGKLRPDNASGSIANASVNTSELPDIAGVADTSQALACSSASGSGTVIEFTTPVQLSAGFTYAIVLSAGCSPSCVRWGIPLHTAPVPNNYSGGSAFQNNGDPNDPADWADHCPLCTDGDSDSGFAIYNTVSVGPVSNDFDSWLINFLNSVHLNSAFGILLAGVTFVVVVFLILSSHKVPWLMSMGVSGMAGTFLVSAALFSPTILLTMVAIIGLGIMGLIFTLVMGGDRNG